MSTFGLVWAVNHSAWCKNAGEFAVLVAIADRVGDDLTGCFAKQSTLALVARCNKRTTGTHVRSLADRKVIVPGNPKLVEKIRADARPDVWDLNADLPETPDDATTGKSCTSRQAKDAGRDKQDLPPATGKKRQTGRQILPTEPVLDPLPEPVHEPVTSAEPTTTPTVVLDGELVDDTEAPAPVTAQTIVSEWLEHCTRRPPTSVIGQVAKHIKNLLADNIHPDDIRRGTAHWMAKGLHPNTLPSVVNEVMNGNAKGPTAPQRPASALFDQATGTTLFDRARARAAARGANRDGYDPGTGMDLFDRAMERAKARDAAAETDPP